MKKFLAIFLALITVTTVSLSACNKEKEDDNNDDDWDTYNWNDDDNRGNSTETGDETGDDWGDETNNGGSSTQRPSGSSVTFKEVESHTVYVLQSVYLRNSAKTNDKSDIALEMNETLTKVAVSNDSEWAKVTYEGETYYIFNYIISTSAVNFTPVDNIETTVINTETDGESTYNLRTTPCLASVGKYGDVLNNLYTSVKKSDTEGGKLIITGYDEANACARVKYNGTECYIYAPYLEYYKSDSNGSSGNTPGPV